jgi:hypothetical protein
MTARRNPVSRRFQIGSKNKSKAEDKAAQPNGADRFGVSMSARESCVAHSGGHSDGHGDGHSDGPSDGHSGERLNRTDRGEVRHRNHIPPATRAISGEAEFKRYLFSE